MVKKLFKEVIGHDGVTYNIYVDMNALKFYANVDGQYVSDYMACEVDRKILEISGSLVKLDWVPVITVDAMFGHHGVFDISLQVDRVHATKRNDGVWMTRYWDMPGNASLMHYKHRSWDCDEIPKVPTVSETDNTPSSISWHFAYTSDLLRAMTDFSRELKKSTKKQIIDFVEEVYERRLEE